MPDFCKNVCASMAKLNKGLKIEHSFQFIWQKVFSYLKTTDVSVMWVKNTIINQIINQVLIDEA